jgi:hypothetical protein
MNTSDKTMKESPNYQLFPDKVPGRMLLINTNIPYFFLAEVLVGGQGFISQQLRQTQERNYLNS